MDPELVRFFDLVCDKIAAHPSYAEKVAGAARDGEQLLLNYHSHGPEQPYCASVCVRQRALAERGLVAPLEELAHIRGIGANAAECGPRMAAFAARLTERYRLARAPLVLLEGEPFATGG